MFNILTCPKDKDMPPVPKDTTPGAEDENLLLEFSIVTF